MKIDRIHHVAYRCNDALETVRWYGKMLNMDLVFAISGDEAPSRGEPDPYMQVVLDAGQGNALAFFELPARPAMSHDPNTPAWARHIAFTVTHRADLLAYRAHLEAHGVQVRGVIDNGLFQSFDFFDPNGHRVELACPNPSEAEQLAQRGTVKSEMLDAWSRTRRAPRQPVPPPEAPAPVSPPAPTASPRGSRGRRARPPACR